MKRGFKLFFLNALIPGQAVRTFHPLQDASTSARQQEKLGDVVVLTYWYKGAL